MSKVKPFWRDELLSDQELELLHAVLRAHDLSAKRNNISSHVLANVAMGSGNYCNALAVAVLSIGGNHAPLGDTIKFLQSLDLWPTLMEPPWGCGLIPGWGNSFVKGEKDPIWLEVDSLLLADWPDLHQRLETVTERLKPKNIFPNPSAYTAATAIALGIPPAAAPWLFIAGRMDAWSELFLKHGIPG